MCVETFRRYVGFYGKPRVSNIVYYFLIISISRSGLLKSCARIIIDRSEIRKK